MAYVFSCERCGKSFDRKFNLKVHLNRMKVCAPVLSNIDRLAHIIKLDETNYRRVGSTTVTPIITAVASTPTTVSTPSLTETAPMDLMTLVQEMQKMRIELDELKQTRKQAHRDKMSSQTKHTLRMKVWESHMGENYRGPCLCCKRQINTFTFVCGHVVSAANGGTNTIDNLKPICAICNTHMSSMDMEEYIELHRVPVAPANKKA
jgi:5-methylcytosine-specific restriction endonuclease McrA